MAGGIDMTIELDGRTAEQLQRAIVQLEDLTEPMGEIAGIMFDATQERFDQERDPLGVPWKRSQAAIEQGRPTLQESRQLRDAVVPEFGRDFAVVGVQDQPASRRDTPVRDYARIHQEGGTIRPRTARALSFAGRIVASVTMPRRAYLGLSAEERREIPAVLVRFLGKLFGGAA